MNNRIDEFYRDEQKWTMAMEHADADRGATSPNSNSDEATYGSALSADTNRRGMYCLGCGHDLQGVYSGECPRCGRRFNREDAGTYTIHPPMQPTWSEASPKGPAAIKLAVLLLPGIAMAWMLLSMGGLGGSLIMLLLLPVWLSAMIWQVLRLAKNDRIDGLWFNMCVGAVAGLGLAALISPIFITRRGDPMMLYFGIAGLGYAVAVGLCVGTLTGLVREYRELAEVAG